MTTQAKNQEPATLKKTLTGIAGLDEITEGGLPQGRPTLVAGNAGCGKTLLGMEFLVNGIVTYNEPGVFVSFEEPVSDLIKNFASLGYDLPTFVKDKKLRIDHVQVERSEIEETGEYDLEGLFIRLGHAIDTIGAKRIVLDTVESLFAGFENDAILRAELRRLFAWLKNKGITAIITGERGEGTLTRQGLEEYVSDCVILLEHSIEDLISTRRLRIIKYRGSTHGTNEYPFLIDKDGITVMPVTSLHLNHAVSSKRISSGNEQLDEMLGGGFYEGSSILLSGTAGTGKTNVAGTLVNAACSQSKRCLYIAFEESPQQIIRNLKSIGIDLERHIKKGLLQFRAVRSTSLGLEMHLASLHKITQEFKPAVVIIDPITTLSNAGAPRDVRIMLTRLMDVLKAEGATCMLTSLTKAGHEIEQTEGAISSFADTWLLLRDQEVNGERNRLLYVLKSRGTEHSNQVREFLIGNKGIQLIDVYLGEDGMLTGTARVTAEARFKARQIEHQAALTGKQRHQEYERLVLQARLKSLQAELDMHQQKMQQLEATEKVRSEGASADKAAIRKARGAKSNGN